jgi:hypothetical protein
MPQGPWGEQPPQGHGYPVGPGQAPGYDAYARQPLPPPDNHLVWGIVTTLLCCLPFGIVSIVKASNVNTLWYQGQYAAAYESAEAAKKWAIWSAATTAVPVGIYLVALVFTMPFTGLR